MTIYVSYEAGQTMASDTDEDLHAFARLEGLRVFSRMKDHMVFMLYSRNLNRMVLVRLVRYGPICLIQVDPHNDCKKGAKIRDGLILRPKIECLICALICVAPPWNPAATHAAWSCQRSWITW